VPVSILTDSAASLPEATAAAAGVLVVPMWLTIGHTSVHDGELGLDEVLSRIDEGITTAGPTPGEFAAALEAKGTGDGALILTIASTMSSTCQAAGVAARSVDPARVRVFDTGTAAGAQGLVVLAAARAAARGDDLDAVEGEAKRVAARVRLVATLPSLDRLATSGRVPEAAALAGRWLGLQPLFEFRSGGARPLRPARSRARALDRIVSRWRRGGPRHQATGRLGCHVAALHAQSPGAADALLERVRASVTPATAFIGSFSPVMVVHTGPGLIGLAWWWEEPARLSTLNDRGAGC